jgi:hypothetical protein
VKALLAACAAMLLASVAYAAPFLYAEAYPSTATQPDAASFTVNGGAPIACQLEALSAGLRPKCDLASITAAGTYTLVLTVSRQPAIVNTSGGATNTQGSTASSAPFVYRLVTAPVAGPMPSVAP